jgi:hypothetical protein
MAVEAGFRIVRQGKHIVMSDGIRILTILRHNPVHTFTMGGIARDAGPSEGVLLPAFGYRSWFGCDCTTFHSHCALSALKTFTPSAPGPLAQAFTFRAVGAGNSLVTQLNEFLDS